MTEGPIIPGRELAGNALVVGLGGRGNIGPRFRFRRGMRNRLVAVAGAGLSLAGAFLWPPLLPPFCSPWL